MTTTIEVQAKPGSPITRLNARLTGNIDSLASRRGEYRLVLVGPAEDVEALAAVARMQPGRVLVQLTEAGDGDD